ncbi:MULTISPECIES: thioredoxin [Clostridium]|uniref:Thioredoxin n=1 Tax=Clostridium paridis TaxID=2803863 RepID=A0A937K4Q4_9CLOT|nr:MULTISPECIES: thioredoxin [Clostridium]MBL4931768.1 thioredoxin [Clostridium paridis]
MARELNSNEFQNEVLNSKDIVLVDFSATWCGPCKMLAPIVEELGKEMEGKVKVFKLDVDKSGDIAQKYQVMAVPTVIIFKNGEVAEKMVGFQPKNVLKDKLEYFSK